MIFMTLLWITRKFRWGVGGRRGMMESEITLAAVDLTSGIRAVNSLTG
jgi:hypothetical protein